MGKIRNFIVAFLFVMLFGVSKTFAMDVSVVATVNGTPITSYELNQRTKLAQRLLDISGIKMDEEKVRDNVLSEMIDDKLKIAEARKYNITVSKDDIDDAVKRMENYLGLFEGEYKKLAEELGVEESVINTKVKAEVIWMKFVFSVLRGYVNITDSEVNLFVDNMKNETHYSYSLVPMIIENDEKYETLKADIERIKNCDEFKEFALQNGQSGSGDLITIKDSQMEKTMAKIIARANVGESVNAKKTSGDGINVFFVCEKNAYKQEITDDKKGELKDSIFKSKLDAFANKYFDKMKKTAVIEIKKD